MAQLAVILLLIGAGLLIGEAFIPGFGVMGVSGILLAVVSFVITVIFVPNGVFIVLGELAGLVLLLFILFKVLKRSQAIHKIILTEKLFDDTAELGNYDGFLGKEATTHTSLRPYGNADFNGNIIGVVSDGNYIAENKRVKVVRVEGNKLFVVRIGN